MSAVYTAFKPPVIELTNRLEKLGPDLQYKGIRAAVVAYAAPIKLAIKAGIRNRSGTLRRSIGHRTVAAREKSLLGYKSSDVVIAVGAVRKVAQPGRLIKQSQSHKLLWLDEGTDAHEIPKKKGLFRRSKKLKIRGAFVSSVSHPGVRARNILEKSVSSTRSASIERFNIKLAQFLDKQK